MPRTFANLEDAAYDAGLQLVLSRERQVTFVLRQALNDIRVTMSKVYERYAKNGLLSRADMTKYNRLVTLEKELLGILGPTITKADRIIKRLPADAYNESFFRYAWAMDNGNGIRLNYGSLNLDTIRANIDNSLGKIALERWGTDARLLVRTALNKGLPLGKSYTAMARDLKEALNTVNYKALRIIRTEGVTALNAGQNEAYKRAQGNGVEGVYIWDATLDGRTRPSHGAMDQEERDETKDPPTFPPLDGVRPRYPGDENLSASERINCRCRLRFQIDGYAPLLRRTREEGLVPYQSYTEWIKGAK